MPNKCKTQFRYLLPMLMIGSSLIVCPTASGQVSTSSSAPVSQVIRKPATVQGLQQAELFAKVGGYLSKVNVDIGDVVAAGDILAELDAPEMEMDRLQKQAMLIRAEAHIIQAKAAVTSAEMHVNALEAAFAESKTMRDQKQASVDLANTEQSRIANLVQRGAVNQERMDEVRFKLQIAEANFRSAEAKIVTAQANFDSAKAEVEARKADEKAAEADRQVAEAALKQSDTMIQYLTIRAPFSGRITRRTFDSGSYVQSAVGNSGARPLFQLVQTDRVRIVFSLSSNEVEHLAIGNKVEFTIGDSNRKTYTGEVTRFAGGLDSESRMLRVETELPNSDQKLLHGMFGNVLVTIGAN